MSSPEYIDDDTILNEAELYRRVPPQWLVRDENLGTVRPSSQAFQDSPNGSPMSVTLADVLSAAGREPSSVLSGHQGFGLVAITAGLARECQQGIMRDPTEEEPAHALVFGKKTGGVKSKFAKQSRWVVEPSETV
jgi:hypothetical protein